MSSTDNINTTEEGTAEKDRRNKESRTVTPPVVAYSSSDVVKLALGTVKVNKHAAFATEKNLKDLHFEKWQESCEVSRTTKVPTSKLSAFVNHIKETYQDIDEHTKKVMDDYANGKLGDRCVTEWNYEKLDNSGKRYGMVTFGRSSDDNYVDCVMVFYKMDFKVVAEKETGLWARLTGKGGKQKKPSTPKETAANFQTSQQIQGAKGGVEPSKEEMGNYFRGKVLDKCCSEGVIESVNYD